MTIGRLVGGIALFAGGVLLSEPVRYHLASARSEEVLPRVSVEYSSRGTLVNGEQVDSLGRIGGARCDWQEIDSAQRAHLVSSALQNEPGVLAQYIRDSPTRDQERLAYLALSQLARKAGSSIAQEVTRIKDAVGFRWELQYTSPLQR